MGADPDHGRRHRRYEQGEAQEGEIVGNIASSDRHRHDHEDQDGERGDGEGRRWGPEEDDRDTEYHDREHYEREADECHSGMILP